MKHFYLSIPLVAIGFLIQSDTVSHKADNASMLSTLWVQNAAEYKTLSFQAYNTAERFLPYALDDKQWTASLEQEKNYENLPPAIVLDVDETVLDNSYYQARLILKGNSFSPDTWNQWVKETKATAIEGALSLTNLADSLGITVFYVTNRDFSTEEETFENLRKLGFPLSDNIGTVLTNGARGDWTSAKTERRKWIAGRYRILMMFGDDLNDFIYAKNKTLAERDNMVQKHINKWGYKWYVLPNPVYGSWEQALVNFESVSTSEKKDHWLDHLKTLN